MVKTFHLTKLGFYSVLLCLFIFSLLTGCAGIPATKPYDVIVKRLELPDGRIYHGAQGEIRPSSRKLRHVDWAGIDRYTKACGNRPKLIMHYISFDSFAFSLLKSTIFEISQQPYDYIPQIGLDFYSYPAGHGIMNPKDITHYIADGEYDKEIRELAQLFIKMETPVFLRPGYEFGGRGQGRHASKQLWIKAWKRIFTIFKDLGAENVEFVWNTLDARDYMDYYPGDEYVDWWAINIFCNNADNNAFINQFIQDAAKHNKPVMIAESTPRYIGSIKGEASWENWYEPYFNLISRYRHIKAFCYINASWDKYPDKSFKFDCRIQNNAFITSKYEQVLSEPRFINANKK
jgi:glycosyl hydrolase family 26